VRDAPTAMARQQRDAERIAAKFGKELPSNWGLKWFGPPSAARARGAIPTNVDSEVKILEDIAKDLPSDAKGTINLFTEREPCPSCKHVIKQFRERFPNIALNVTHGAR